MNTTELMLGDWVYWHDEDDELHTQAGRVEGLVSGWISVSGNFEPINANQIEPIPISFDMLKGNGFESNDDRMFDLGEVTLIFHRQNHRYGVHIGTTYLGEVTYAHELQHILKMVRPNNDCIKLFDEY